MPAPPFAVLRDPSGPGWCRFVRPRAIIEAWSLDEVRPALRRIEALVEGEGLWAAGAVAYDAAPAFDRALEARRSPSLPLVWFAVGDAPEPFDLPPPPAGRPPAIPWAPTNDAAAHAAAVSRIRARIAAGDTYQVNHTFRLRAPFDGDAWEVFLRMAHAQPSPHALFLDTGDWAVASASPELCFARDGTRITCRPMKGTAARGRTTDEDEARASWLQASAKNRAENVMIVDMIRNDLGRVAEIGSVTVTDLFRTERYPTLWQMTSTVTAESCATLDEIFAAVFPCASVTGAPKARTCALIADLETTPRGFYTGCLGVIAPGGVARFNVAIRTLVVDRRASRAEYGVGSGVTWDSDPAGEYEECLAKAQVLLNPPEPVTLLETLLWEPPGGWFLREAHLDRLERSAGYFDVPFDRAAIIARLDAAPARAGAGPCVVRLRLAPDGDIETDTRARPEPRPVVRLALAAAPVDTTDVFLFHKTTRRAAYDAALASVPGADDALLWNERGEITETTIANVVVDLDGTLCTPPVACGLLAGTYRGSLLDAGLVEERVIRLDDLRRARAIHVVNAVRRWERATLVSPDPAPR
ncbi:MAG: chorismate-binding protein [Vicinamibacterales bacterium]